MNAPLLNAFSLYIASSKSIEDVARETSTDIDVLRKTAKAQGWTEARKAVAEKARQMVKSDVSGDKIASIRRIQARERKTLERRLRTLEAVLDSLDPTAEKEIDRLTVSKLKAYAETAALFQKMLYKSYGIDDGRQSADDDGIFAAVRPGEVITRYRIDRVERAATTPPPTGKTAAPTDPHLPPTDITSGNLPEPVLRASGESIAEVVEEPRRRRRGKLSGYELTDVFDNITKENRDEEGREGSDGAQRGEEGGEGAAGAGGGGGEEADEGAAGDAEEAQGVVVDGCEGLADGAPGDDRAEDGEGEDVGDSAGMGDGAAYGGPEEDKGVAEEGVAGAGVS